jgi:hypothetical protein
LSRADVDGTVVGMIEGSCLCGAVRFAVDGWVSPLQFCHCTHCRKVSGGAFVAAVVAPTEKVRWLQGAEMVAEFALPVRVEPPPYRTAFCRVCGSPVPIVDAQRPFAIIPAGALDGEPPLRPFRHIFVSLNPSWYEIRDDLPQFEQHVPPDQRLPTKR